MMRWTIKEMEGNNMKTLQYISMLEMNIFPPANSMI